MKFKKYKYLFKKRKRLPVTIKNYLIKQKKAPQCPVKKVAARAWPRPDRLFANDR
jgi:hypothetical protein